MKATGNPFASHRLDDLAFVGSQPAELLGELARLGSRAFILGNHGHGKSRAVASLIEYGDQNGLSVARIELWDEKRRPSLNEVARVASAELIVIDGFEQMPLIDRYRLLAALPRRADIIATAHRLPLWPRWPVLAHLETSPALLTTLLLQLGVELDEAQIAHRWSVAEGDLREVFWRLFDDYPEGISTPLRLATSTNCGGSHPAAISRSARA